MGIEMRDPGALAGATGAEIEAGRPKEYGSPIHMATRHLSAARMFRITLTLGACRFTEEGRMAAWLAFARVITVRLTLQERFLLAYWINRTLPADIRRDAFEGAHWRLHDEE